LFVLKKGITFLVANGKSNEKIEQVQSLSAIGELARIGLRIS
jgi:hypothetical protein